MGGLVTTTRQKGRASGYANSGYTFTRFTSTQTIAKPLGCTFIVIECVGGGGQGGGGRGNGGDEGGGGGGGNYAPNKVGGAGGRGEVRIYTVI